MDKVENTDPGVQFTPPVYVIATIKL